ncbi:MAG TPA: hypothetical protein VMH02_12975 [Verrucomicrobiae bacterium]|nr:hypothetical protein [Verrucomicrobiae bacterium]
MRRIVSIVAAAAFAGSLAVPALAVTGQAPSWSAEYVAAYQPTFGTQGPPYAGDLKLTVNNGVVKGTYTAFSSRPDPYYGRIINVTGGTSNGHISLRIGGLSLQNGKIAQNGDISGTANWNGKLYTFEAKPRPQEPYAPTRL